MAAYKGNTVTHVEVLERLHRGRYGTELQLLSCLLTSSEVHEPDKRKKKSSLETHSVSKRSSIKRNIFEVNAFNFEVS